MLGGLAACSLTSLPHNPWALLPDECAGTQATSAVNFLTILAGGPVAWLAACRAAGCIHIAYCTGLACGLHGDPSAHAGAFVLAWIDSRMKLEIFKSKTRISRKLQPKKTALGAVLWRSVLLIARRALGVGLLWTSGPCSGPSRPGFRARTRHRHGGLAAQCWHGQLPRVRR